MFEKQHPCSYCHSYLIESLFPILIHREHECIGKLREFPYSQSSLIALCQSIGFLCRLMSPVTLQS